MHGSDENSGIISFLIGIVLVVFCGIGLSLLVDTRLNFGSSKTSLKNEIDTDRIKQGKLITEIENAKDSWDRNHAPTIDHDKSVDELRTIAANNVARLEELRVRKKALTKSLEQVSETHRTYRINYRKQALADSVGQQHESLTLANGRTYRDLEVRGFDTTGLRIHHSGGSTRIRYRDLPNAWIERLQWQADELTDPESVASETDKTKDARDIPKANLPKSRPKKKLISPDAAEITKMRNQFLLARKAYTYARSQASIARGNAHDSRKSVPGSLETWADRADRMERLSQRNYARYQKARIDLSSVSPHDPLLYQTTP